MALEYSYDPKARLVHIVGRGIVSLNDRIQMVDRLLDDPNVASGAAILIDVNAVENAPTPEEIWAIGMLIERLRSRIQGRLTIVNTRVGHVTLSHLVAYSVREAQSQVQVFTREEAARDWLLS
jgi:hypothetical protein